MYIIESLQVFDYNEFRTMFLDYFINDCEVNMIKKNSEKI